MDPFISSLLLIFALTFAMKLTEAILMLRSDML